MSSSVYASNKTRNILVLGKDFIQGIDDTTIYAEKMYSTNFTVANKKFFFSVCIIMVIVVIYFSMAKRLLILTLLCIKWVPGDPSTIFLATNFTQKMPKGSDSMFSSNLMLENIWYHHFTWSGSNS